MMKLSLCPMIVTAISCALPSDQSTTLSVVLDPVPELFAGDTVQATAHVIDGSGHEVAGVAIEFGSSDPTVAAVTPEGRVAAVSPGTVSVLARAPGLESATPGRTPAVVHGAIGIDSILPSHVRYGSQLEIYGIGLDPAGAAVVSTGGVTAPIVSFIPMKPGHPEQYGVLAVLIVPPLGQSSDGLTAMDVPVTVTNTRGVATRVANVVVEPRDIYEPNDTTPADLGMITGRYEALGLAFDNWGLDPPGYPVDWFRFITASPGDWTITLRSADASQADDATADLIEGPLSISVQGDFENDLYWYIDQPSRRTIGTSSTCKGFAGLLDPDFDPPQAAGYGVGWTALKRQLSWTLEDLPAGVHDLLVGSFHVRASSVAPGSSPADGLFRSAWHTQRFNPSGTGTIRYDLLIEPGIHGTLPADRFEGNDFCEDAPTLLSLDATAFSDSVFDGLTVDAELDYDWFIIDAHTPGRLFLTVESDDQNAKNSPLILSATPGSGPAGTHIELEAFSESDGSFGAAQQLVSNRDFAPGVSLDAKPYYLEIEGGLPRAYRLRFSWAPGALATSGLLSIPPRSSSPALRRAPYPSGPLERRTFKTRGRGSP